MKRKLTSWALAGLLVLSLTGCGSGGPELGEVFDGTVNDYEGVTMTVVEGTAAPGQVTVTVVNDAGLDVHSSVPEDFGLQIQQDGLWYWLEWQGAEEDAAAMAGKSVILAPGDSLDLTCTWGSNYGSLEAGRYRVTNWAFANPVPGADSVHFLLAAEFTLE